MKDTANSYELGAEIDLKQLEVARETFRPVYNQMKRLHPKADEIQLCVWSLLAIKIDAVKMIKVKKQPRPVEKPVDGSHKQQDT